MKKDTLCVLPWMHLATNASGNLRVCCNSTPDKNLILRDDNITPYNISDEDAKDFWSSKTLINLRQEFLDGQKPEMCQRCFEEEEIGIKSAREAWNKNWIIDCSSSNPPINIKYVDIRLGNLCNLKCRMCNPYASNQWVGEWNDLGYKLSNKEIIRLSKMNWFDSEIVWDNLIKLSNNVEEIYFTGGEPTLAISQYILLDRLISLGIAKNIILKYNTNLTNVPKKMIGYWKYFKKVKINASLDAYNDLNRYIRYPSSWNQIVKNLFLFKHLEQNENVKLQIHITVQAYNVYYLPELFDYLINNDFTDIYLNILDHPECLNVKVLPDELKQITCKRLFNFKQIFKVEGLIDYINSESTNNKYWIQFKNYTSILDSNRDQSLIEVAPIFKNFI